MAGTGDYALGWSSLCTFLKTHGLTPLSDAFFNADHDKFIESYIFEEELVLPLAFSAK